MFDLKKLIRPNIAALRPYSSARDEFSGCEGVFLDANENPFGELNRYPDPYQRQLKEKLSELKDSPAENIFLGNGSDEVIDLLFRIFCQPGIDRALTFAPTYGMYRVSAGINDVELLEPKLNEDFDLDAKPVKEALAQGNLKLIFLCSPNNPTGNTLSRESVEKLLRAFKGLVIVDEAYADFCEAPSWKERLKEFPNLVVMQTLSKAWGLAAARVGMAFASAEIIGLLNKVKPPYNISGPNQVAALQALNDWENFQKRLGTIKREKARLLDELSALRLIRKIYPSSANFILVEVAHADRLYHRLLQQKIVLRNRSSQIENCLRITVGTPAENDKLIEALKNEESTFY